MRQESTQLTLISASITIVALIAIIARIMMPTMMIDSITLWLLAIAIVPWLAPLIKSIEWGGAKIEFQERIKKLETDTTNMHTEMANMAQTLDNMMHDTTAGSEQLPTGAISPLTSVFVHVATMDNTKSNYTIIDNPLTNNSPNAILMVTQNWSPSASKGGVYNAQPIGVWYTSEGNTHEGRWSIFNQNPHVRMPEGAAFNVQVLNQS